MKILKITAINFMSYERIELDLTEYSGITLISGANGTGKSSIFEMITWGLFGRTLRNMSADDVVREGCDACEVWLTVDTVRDMIEVKRRRTASGRTILSFGGIKGGTVTGKQEVLEKKLNCDYKYFINTVMFGGRASSFCAMTDSERKRILEELLGFDVYARGCKKAKKDRIIYSQKLESYKLELLQVDEQMKDYEENLQRYKDEFASFQINWNSALLEFDHELGELQREEHEVLGGIIHEK